VLNSHTPAAITTASNAAAPVNHLRRVLTPHSWQALL
jgi:hypothetical protein